MSDARSLTPLSETDYDAIAAAVMETARGRWFMAEFARRNRRADTDQVLAAIGRLQRSLDVPAQAAAPSSGPNLREAIALIMDLRTDLERISGVTNGPSSGLAARIETAAGHILGATESIQEAAWSLREAGADEALCDALDRRSTEIYGATAIVEGTAHQIGKIADTIAMLDSSLRAFAEDAHDTLAFAPEPAPSPAANFDMREASPLSSYDDIEIVEIDDGPAAMTDTGRIRAEPASHRRLNTIQVLDEDLDFSEIGTAATAAAAPASAPVAKTASEAELRAIDALPASGKLAYFA